jgi:LmbE family N-acetylglucosaminyl deacetylase
MNRKLAGLGTPARAWRDWPGFDALPVIAPEMLVQKGRRAVVVAPYPDGEGLGIGGLIARLTMVKRPIFRVALTDDAARRPAPSRRTARRPGDDWPRDARSVRRPPGTDPVAILHAGLEEGEFARVESDLEWRLRGLILPSDVVFTTWRYDGQPDHEAAGRLAARACAALLVHLVEVPVWAWQWSFPGDRRIPWKRARRVFLSRALRVRKRQALAEYQRRIESDPPHSRHAMLPSTVLERFMRPYEIVFV